MFLVLKLVLKSENVVCVRVSIVIDVAEQLNFINALVEVVFVVVDYLEADQFLANDVFAHLCFAKRGTAKIVYENLPPSYKSWSFHVEFFTLLKASLLSVKYHFQVECIKNRIVNFNWILVVFCMRNLYILRQNGRFWMFWK